MPTTSRAAPFDPAELLDYPIDYDDRYMPDEATRDHARRMHYSAHRMHNARTPAELNRWTRAYHSLRDQIVLGNRKLIYRAVRRRMSAQNRAEDMIGDCHIVLIQAVAAYNPWLGIRFSTYAYTCHGASPCPHESAALDRLAGARSMSWKALPDGEPRGPLPARTVHARHVPHRRVFARRPAHSCSYP